MIAPSAEQRIAEIRERLEGHTFAAANDIQYLLDLLASQDRALGEAQREIERLTSEHDNLCTAVWGSDNWCACDIYAHIDSLHDAEVQLTAAQGEIARLKAASEQREHHLGQMNAAHRRVVQALEQAEAERERLQKVLAEVRRLANLMLAEGEPVNAWGFDIEQVLALSTPARPTEEP